MNQSEKREHISHELAGTELNEVIDIIAKYNLVIDQLIRWFYICICVD